MDFLKRLDFYLKLIYNAATQQIRFTTTPAPSAHDIGDYANLDEVLLQIYDPSSQSFRLMLNGGMVLEMETDEIVGVLGQTDYALSAMPKGKVFITPKGGGRISYSDVGGITIVDVAGTPTIQFGTAPTAGQTIFIDYLS